jgi:hypothetical protein
VQEKSNTGNVYGLDTKWYIMIILTIHQQLKKLTEFSTKKENQLILQGGNLKYKHSLDISLFSNRWWEDKQPKIIYKRP